MSEKEIWKDIEDYKGIYQVSNLGRVRSLDRVDGSGRGWKGRMLSSKLRKNGYREVIICRDGKRKYMLVHRLVAEAREKPIYVVTNSGHRYYFSGVSKAARLLGLHYQNITACLHGRQKTCHGYSFELAV